MYYLEICFIKRRFKPSTAISEVFLGALVIIADFFIIA
jgi:hypothetical protein